MIAPAAPPLPSVASDRVDALCDAILAMGVVFAGAPAFRIELLPLGPGEACLVGWIGLATCRECLAGSGSLGRPAHAIVAFWTVFAIAQSLGFIMALSIERAIDWPPILHDTLAFAVMALLSILCLCVRDARLRLCRVARYAMILGSITLSLQVASAGSWNAVPAIDPWFWDRFRGWSDNPNQLSLFCAVLVPIALFALEAASSTADRVTAITCTVAALAAGILTKGNSLRLALAVGGCCAALLVVARLLGTRDARTDDQKLPLAFAAVCAPVLLLAVLPYLASQQTGNIATQVSRDGAETVNEAVLRVELWDGAVDAGIRSSYFGLGPGPHSPIPGKVVVRERWDPDETDRSLPNAADYGATMESHNTYLELFSQGGLILLLAYVALLVLAMRRALSTGSLALPALVCVIAVFGFFHVVFRHPIVWFGLCLCLGNALAPPKGARHGPRFAPNHEAGEA